MNLTYINPYTFIESDYKNGMNAIGGTLSMMYPNPTIENLVNAVYDYVVTTYLVDPPPLRQAQSLRSSIYAMLNGY